MTVPVSAERDDYTGDGSTNIYSYSYRITYQTHLLVTVADTDGAETTLVIGTDYTVSGVGVKTGGTITLVNNSQAWLTSGNLTTGYALTVRHVVPLSQSTDIRNLGSYYPETHEDTFDYLMWCIKQQQDEINRSVKVGETDTNPPTVASITVAVGQAESARDDAEAASLVAIAASASAENYAEALTSTSTSSIEITVAQKTFVTQASKQFTAGMVVLVVDSANASNYIYGTVNAYSGTSLVVDTIAVGGSGIIASWNIFVSGIRGPVGATGAAGPAGVGSGDVLGPATNSDAFVPQWDGANSKTLKNGIQVGNGASMLLQLNASSQIPAVSGALLTNLPAQLPSQTGNAGKVLSTDGSNPSWIASSNIPTYKTSDSSFFAGADDLVEQLNQTSYTKVKEITLYGTGVVKVYFDLYTSDAGVAAIGRVYKNGSAVGTERASTSVSLSPETFSEDFSGLSNGDKLQLYIKSASIGAFVRAKNFRLSGSLSTIDIN